MRQNESKYMDMIHRYMPFQYFDMSGFVYLSDQFLYPCYCWLCQYELANGTSDSRKYGLTGDRVTCRKPAKVFAYSWFFLEVSATSLLSGCDFLRPAVKVWLARYIIQNFSLEYEPDRDSQKAIKNFTDIPFFGKFPFTLTNTKSNRSGDQL
jgi:hypothetical protein